MKSEHPNSHTQSANLILLNKPFRVLSQFSEQDDKTTLAAFIKQKGFYPAGRLDFDSEGLLLLTDNGQLQAHISDPKYKTQKTYWAQVEGDITDEALRQLADGVELKDGLTRPAQAKKIAPPNHLWERHPPIRERKNIPTSWIELSIREGKNRQVRRMTAAVGFPTLRLIRYAIGDWNIDQLAPGEHKLIQTSFVAKKSNARSSQQKNNRSNQRRPRKHANHKGKTNRR